MNFVFTITTHGFEKAGAVEKYLKDMGVPFEVKISPPVNGAKLIRKVLTKAEVMAVVSTIDAHPDWSDKTVAKQAGCGHNTINRIRRGIHSLCDPQ